MPNDYDKYEEFMELKDKIAIQLDDIKNNVDEETFAKMQRLHTHLNNKHSSESVDIDKRIEKLNKINHGLGFYQKFLYTFERNVDIDPGRLMGLTDGIFGMVMTLLVFGMALPEFELVTEGDFVHFIFSSFPTVGITIVSFVLISSFWIYHHEFIKLKNLNIPYLWINIIFLACISFIPFTTSIIGVYSHFFLAEVVFGFNIFITLIFFILMIWYAHHRGFMEEKISDAEKKYTYQTFFIIMILTMIVNILDFTVSPNFIYLFLLVPIISTIRDIMFKMKT